MKSFCLTLVGLASGSIVHGQQIADSAFHFRNDRPAFSAGAGPAVCVDAAHNNMHTLDGRYYAFGKLLREDGFRPTSLTKPADRAGLAGCAVLVIANALPSPAGTPGADFSAPAIPSEQSNRILEWVIEGGRLLLILDHAPYPAAAAYLAQGLGVVPLNGGVSYRMFGALPEEPVRAITRQEGITIDSIRRVLGPLGTLGDHAILQGRPGVDSPVRTLLTFGGSAFYPAQDVRPLLQVPARAKGTVWLPGRSREQSPRFALEGWLVGGARQVGAGRVVILGEAAMCSAQLAGPGRTLMGMNDPLSADNAQFCLNVIRWLAGVI